MTFTTATTEKWKQKQKTFFKDIEVKLGVDIFI